MNMNYGCEDKKYYISFYPNFIEKQEQYGCTKNIRGIVKNFNPSEHVAIEDIKGCLWVVDYKLIAIMRPLNEIELRTWRKEKKYYKKVVDGCLSS